MNPTLKTSHWPPEEACWYSWGAIDPKLMSLCDIGWKGCHSSCWIPVTSWTNAAKMNGAVWRNIFRIFSKLYLCQICSSADFILKQIELVNDQIIIRIYSRTRLPHFHYSNVLSLLIMLFYEIYKPTFILFKFLLEIATLFIQLFLSCTYSYARVDCKASIHLLYEEWSAFLYNYYEHLHVLYN